MFLHSTIVTFLAQQYPHNVTMDKGKPSFLALVVDVPSFLTSVSSKVGLANTEGVTTAIRELVGAVTVFCNSYALMHRENRIAVICCLGDHSEVIYPVVSEQSEAGFIPVLHVLALQLSSGILKAVSDQLIHLASTPIADQSRTRGTLSQAFSMALSILNRHKHVQSRVLVLQFDRDRSQNYNALMNSIFSAQKLNVLVDALVAASFDSHLLQQACFLTGGVYLKHADAADLLQVLLAHFLADNATRKLLALPVQTSVDFKAACHCHQKPVEFAFMCSVCLTLTCQAADRCEVCATEARK